MCSPPPFNFLILKITRKIFTQQRYVYVKQVRLCKVPVMQYLLDKLLLLLLPQHPSHPKQARWRYSLIPRWDSWIRKWNSWPLENKLGSQSGPKGVGLRWTPQGKFLPEVSTSIEIVRGSSALPFFWPAFICSCFQIIELCLCLRDLYKTFLFSIHWLRPQGMWWFIR